MINCIKYLDPTQKEEVYLHIDVTDKQSVLNDFIEYYKGDVPVILRTNDTDIRHFNIGSNIGCNAEELLFSGKWRIAWKEELDIDEIKRFVNQAQPGDINFYIENLNRYINGSVSGDELIYKLNNIRVILKHKSFMSRYLIDLLKRINVGEIELKNNLMAILGFLEMKKKSDISTNNSTNNFNSNNQYNLFSHNKIVIAGIAIIALIILIKYLTH